MELPHWMVEADSAEHAKALACDQAEHSGHVVDSVEANEGQNGMWEVIVIAKDGNLPR
jgi:hypothetical protein